MSHVSPLGEPEPIGGPDNTGWNPFAVHQRGFVSSLWLASVAGLVTTISVGLLMAHDQEHSNRADVDRRAYIADVSARLARWYEFNAGATGALAGQLDVPAALAQAGVTPRYNLQVASSNRLADGMVAWHVMALWLPDPDSVQGIALDPLTGGFTQGAYISSGLPAQVVHAVVDGHASQLRRYSESSRRIREIGARLENRFSAMRAAHPLMPMFTNWYRAQDCGAVQGGELPCYDAYQNIATTEVPAAAGTSPASDFNAWGGVVQVSNLADSSIVPPFSMSIRTALPWGGWLQVIAQEP